MQDVCFLYSCFGRKKYGSDEIEQSKDYAFVG